jgi:hypothetical protein
MIGVSILATLLALTVPAAFAEDGIHGEFTCTVKDISVMGHKDGVIKKYSGIEGGIELADKITVAYRHSSSSLIHIRATHHKSLLIWAAYSPGEFSSIHDYSSDSGWAYGMSNGGLGTQIIFGEDKFFAKDELDTVENRSLSMSRYFKNDWSAVLTNHPARGNSWAETYLMDCRHVSDAMSDFLKPLREASEKFQAKVQGILESMRQ